MKPILYTILAMCLLTTACNNESTNTEVTLMFDQTDRQHVHPSAEAILAPFKLNVNPWQGLQITIVPISDKDVNTVDIVSLPSENRLTGNITIRRVNIRRFAQHLRQSIASLDSVHTLPRSIIFRAIEKQAESLAKRPAARHVILVYSDLMENSELSFYDRQTLGLLQSAPSLIEKQLMANAVISNLSGVELWLLYDPQGYRQNNIYMSIARFYERIYKMHGAQVHIEDQFAPL